MRDGVYEGLSGARDDVAEARAAVKTGPEGYHVEEQSHAVVELLDLADGGERPDRQVGRAGDLVSQDVEGGEQDREHGGARGCGDSGSPGHDVGLDAVRVHRVRPGVALRVAVIVGYGEFAGAAELVPPVGGGAVFGGAGGTGSLPFGVLAVLAYGRKLGGGAGDPSGIERTEVTQNHLGGPGIACRVVHRKEHDTVAVVEFI